MLRGLLVNFRRRNQITVILFFIFATLSVCLFLNNTYFYTVCQDSESESLNFKTKDHQKQFCSLPDLDSNHPSILDVMENEKNVPLNCSKKVPTLFDSWVHEKPFPPRLVPVGNFKGIRSCCYRLILFNRPNQFSKECWRVSLVWETVIPKEHSFISIECAFMNWRINQRVIVDMHAFIHPGQKKTQKVGGAKDKANVVILGVDSMSRMNFYRTMGKTRDYLENELNAVAMEGMNKIGENTFPNIGAMVTNRYISDDIRISCMTNGSPETCDFVWLHYSKKGYRVLYAEDEVRAGLFRLLELAGVGDFNSSSGSEKTPEFYFPPFLKVIDKYLGHERRVVGNLCLGPRSALEKTLEYLKMMTVAMEETGHNYFQFGWFSALTHDFLYGGRLADDEYKSFLKWSHQNGYLDNTLLIIMSDHGALIGDIRSSDQGQLEDKLPFIYIIPPKFWRERYPKAFENMQNNRKRLITVWDVRQTMEHILQPEHLQDDKLREFHEISRNRSQDFSLFLPVPASRTCGDAGIPLIYCTCNYQMEMVPLNDTRIVYFVNQVLEHFNSILRPYPQCAQLSIGQVMKASRHSFKENNQEDKHNIWEAYQIAFDTVPKWTTFDAWLTRQDEGSEGIDIGDKWITRHHGRSTWYTLDQRSACLRDADNNIDLDLRSVRPLCYCQ